MDEPYKSLYRESDTEDSERSEIVTESFQESWGWHIVLDMLSSNDPTKWDEITKWNVIKFLNTIAYYKAKNANIKENA